jgi:hypothetical protein
MMAFLPRGDDLHAHASLKVSLKDLDKLIGNGVYLVWREQSLRGIRHVAICVVAQDTAPQEASRVGAV